jgi:hypothetical protein
MFEALDFDFEQMTIAQAKDFSWVHTLECGYPKRFNPLALLAETSIPCLTRIAENTSVPSSLLEQLAFHPDPSVREAVADNSNTPIDTLWVLAGDENADVRYAMAENYHLPTDILSALSLDDNPYVSSRAQATLSRLGFTGEIIEADFGSTEEERAVRFN